MAKIKALVLVLKLLEASGDSCDLELEGSASPALLQAAGALGLRHAFWPHDDLAQDDLAQDVVAESAIPNPITPHYAWIHFPKAGSSFGLALMTLPGACNPGWVDKVVSMSQEAYFDQNHTPHVLDIVMDQIVNASTCPGLFAKKVPPELENVRAECQEKVVKMIGARILSVHSEEDMMTLQLGDVRSLVFGSIQPGVSDYAFASSHFGIDSMYSQIIFGRAVAMFRKPEARILSGFNDLYHSWPACALPGSLPSLLEYAQVTAGCGVKMITRSGESYKAGWSSTVCGSSIPATQAETDLAVQRLQEGFLFVGLQEQWELSICLLHKQFGGECSQPEFFDWNNGTTKKPYWQETYNLSDLGDFKDVHDGILYAEAERSFNQSLLVFDVSYSSCQPCFEAAGVTIDEDQ